MQYLSISHHLPEKKQAAIYEQPYGGGHVPREGGLMSTASEELRPSSNHTSELGSGIKPWDSYNLANDLTTDL